MNFTAGDVVRLNALQEQFEHEVPCGGNLFPVEHGCHRAAVLRLVGSCCRTPVAPQDFKCLKCWQEWWIGAAQNLAETGRIQCRDCGAIAHGVDDLGRYIPL